LIARIHLKADEYFELKEIRVETKVLLIVNLLNFMEGIKFSAKLNSQKKIEVKHKADNDFYSYSLY
jgi:hypothetical protein